MIIYFVNNEKFEQKIKTLSSVYQLTNKYAKRYKESEEA